MIAAFLLMVIFAVTFSIVQIASVALRLTGMSEEQARFQALSALSGTGFTTSESEMIVNYPIRRKTVTILMIVGNMGLVSFFATFMISFLRTDAQLPSILSQLIWIVIGLGGLFLFLTHKSIDKFLCEVISQYLRKFTRIGARRFDRLVQLGDGISIVEHHLAVEENIFIHEFLAEDPSLTLLALRSSEGKTLINVPDGQQLSHGDALILCGPDSAHERLAQGVNKA